MLKKKLIPPAAVLFFLIICAAPQAQSNMYYALSMGTYYTALQSEGYTAAYKSGSELYEKPAKPAIGKFDEATEGEVRATAVTLDTRTEFPVYERRHYKRLPAEETAFEFNAGPTPQVSSVNKVMIAPHGYNTFKREFTENYVMPDFRTEVWLEKPYLLGSRMQILKDNSISHTHAPDYDGNE